MKLKKIPGSWYFLISVILIYLILFILRKDLFLLSSKFFYKIFLKLIPIFLIIFVLMALSNLISPKFMMKHLKQKGAKKWIFVILGGILSAGPIYMWYPLLADLKNKGLNYGLIACFLYNRAIKIPLLPIAIFYFGLNYIIILMVIMIFASVIQGILLNKLMKKNDLQMD